MDGRIEQDGFVSEYQYQDAPSEARAIHYPVTGHFVMIEDRPDTLKLYDDHVRHFHPIGNVALTWGVSNTHEGRKKFPRPFIFKTKDGDPNGIGTELVTPGDKLLIVYVGGDIYHPLVVGSIEHLATPYQHAFLRLDGTNLDRQAERYDTPHYTLEFENDGHGSLALKIVTKDTGEPTGNITLDLAGPKGGGMITVRTNGSVRLSQNRDDQEVQHILMDPDAGIRMQGQKQKISEHAVYGETLVTVLEDLIAEIKSLTVPTPSGVSFTPNNAAAFEKIKTRLNKILVD